MTHKHEAQSLTKYSLKLHLGNHLFSTYQERSNLYLPTDAQQSSFKRMLKFTIKQLLHVSVQSPSSGSALFELAKVIVVKIIS